MHGIDLTKPFHAKTRDHMGVFEINHSAYSNNLVKKSSRTVSTNNYEANVNAKKESITFLLKEVLYNSYAQAIIAFVLTPHLLMKAFLAVCILGSSGLASYIIIQTIMAYLSFGVTTTSRTIFETHALFPKATFCNVNSLTTQYAYNLTEKRFSYNQFLNLSNKEKKKLSHDLKDIFISCEFNGNPCDSSDFTWSFDPWYYNCYTFNSGFDSNGTKIDLKQSTITGPELGLKLILYVNIHELIYYQISTELGVILRIDNSSYSTFYAKRDGILLSPGFQTNIAVDREFHSMLPKPYSNCEIDTNSPLFRPDSEFYNVIRQSEYAYTKKLCFIQCYQSYIINKYNCSYPEMLSLFNASKCDLTKITFYDTTDRFSVNIINEMCLSSCPLECNQNLYKKSISFNQLNVNSYNYDFFKIITDNPNLMSDFEKRELSLYDVQESFVHVNIFYDSLSYTESIESPRMDFVSLLASIGGNLSLFLGVSLFSLFEIVQVTLEIVFSLKERNKHIRPILIDRNDRKY